ncbi:MAG: hypothetical protein HY904_05425 [Deltaproteobacteria bacterium]|nr:hypothetical protein [Deltaproteobacteria bacterium]
MSEPVRTSGLRPTAALALVVGLAALPRLAGLFTDFTTDEVWSLLLALHARSAGALVWGTFHDNNHPLNSLFLRALGEQRYWFVYRLPAFVLGLGAVGAAVWWGRLAGARAALICGGVVAANHLMIVYASEARGYAALCFFCLVALALDERLRTGPAPLPRAIFWGACLLGALAHLQFAFWFAALLAGALVRVTHGGESWKRAAAQYAPALVAVALCAARARGMVIGGNPEEPLSSVVVHAAAWTVSLGGWSPFAVDAVMFAVACVGLGLGTAGRFTPDRVAFAVCLVVLPFATGAFTAISVRYLLVVALGALLGLGRVLDLGLARRGAPRLGAVLISGLWLAGQARFETEFQAEGRGAYLDAFQVMADSCRERPRVVVGNNDFRTELLAGFYRPYLELAHALEVRAAATALASPPDWYLATGRGVAATASPALPLGGQGEFRPVLVRPCRTVSCTEVVLYRRFP